MPLYQINHVGNSVAPSLDPALFGMRLRARVGNLGQCGRLVEGTIKLAGTVDPASAIVDVSPVNMVLKALNVVLSDACVQFDELEVLVGKV
jgi:hypothetical protein